MLASTIQISNNNPTPPPPTSIKLAAGTAGSEAPHDTPTYAQIRPETFRYVHRRASDSSEPQQCVCLDPHPTHNRGDGDTTTTPAAEPRTSGGVGLFPHL